MNYERLAEFSNVEDVATQEKIIFDATTYDVVIKEYNRHFFDYIGNWPISFSKYIDQESFNDIHHSRDYYRLVTLTNLQGVQFGYDSIAGQASSASNKWNKSPFDPRRELALACHIAYLNTKANPIKATLSDYYEQEGLLESMVGVWGTPFSTEMGEIISPKPDELTSMWWKNKTINRYLNTRKIVIPNIDLNERLVELNFSIKEAEEMTDEHFKDETIPRIVHALGDYLDPWLAFFSTRRNPIT